MNYLLHRDTLFATISVFLLIGIFSLFHFNTHLFDPIQKALHDFDFNDLSYAKMNKASGSAEDDNITIVNIGNADRGTLALLINKLNTYQPAAIGADIVFDEENRSEHDSSLAGIISNSPKLVIGERVISSENNSKAEGMFTNKNNVGYVNFGGEEGGVIRSFQPTETIDNVVHYSFPVKVLEKAYPDKAKQFLQRDKKEEIINYTRTADKYFTINYTDVLTDGVDANRIKGKIILLGYIPQHDDIQDLKFTPLNKKYVGKSIPDMPGVAVHANIISMLLKGNYVYQIPKWLTVVVAFFFTWLSMALFVRFFLKSHIWFHLRCKVVQLLIAALFVYIGLYSYHYFDAKLDLTLALLGVLLAVDVLYFYEALAKWLNKKFHFKTLFTSSHH